MWAEGHNLVVQRAEKGAQETHSRLILPEKSRISPEKIAFFERSLPARSVNVLAVFVMHSLGAPDPG